MLFVILLVTRNGFVIGFQGVSAKAAVIADLEAHDDEGNNHMSLRSFYWFIVKLRNKTNELFFLLGSIKECGLILKRCEAIWTCAGSSWRRSNYDGVLDQKSNVKSRWMWYFVHTQRMLLRRKAHKK